MTAAIFSVDARDRRRVPLVRAPMRRHSPISGWRSMIGPSTSQRRREEPRRTIRAFPTALSHGRAGDRASWQAAALWLRHRLADRSGRCRGTAVRRASRTWSRTIVADQKAATIEAQLAAAIYLMVGSLRAGASLLAAFESALEEVGPPLRPYFQEVAGRIRLGDDPRAAVSDLQRERAARNIPAVCDVAGHPLGGRRQPGDDAVDGGADGSRSHRAVAARARAGRRIAGVGGGRPRHRVRARLPDVADESGSAGSVRPDRHRHRHRRRRHHAAGDWPGVDVAGSTEARF